MKNIVKKAERKALKSRSQAVKKADKTLSQAVKKADKTSKATPPSAKASAKAPKKAPSRQSPPAKPSKTPPRNGAQSIMDFLRSAGVEVIFGYPGGAVIPLYDAVYDAGLRHVLTRHEQAAIHAADGYARASGKVGVVFATSGPGATNLVTGLATAHMDSVPILAITGQVPTTSLGSDSFQEADIYGISIPITKYNYLVKDPAKLPSILWEAHHLAGTGRPGPVLIDVPKDVQTALITAGRGPSDLPDKNGHPLSETEVKAVLEAIAQSQRPVAYLGGGASKSAEQILALCESQDMAVVGTLQAKGVFPDDHELSLGLPGMHGSKYANLAINESDLILGLGVRFDDRVVGNVRRFAPFARVVHVDIDPAEIGKRLPVDIAVIGDLSEVVSALNKGVKKRSRPEWKARISELRRLHPLSSKGNGKTIKPQAAIRALSDLCAGKAVVVTDVGQHQMWAAQHFQCKAPRRFLSSGGLGTMGFGLPAAMGAAIAKPENPVALIVGDGGFQMNIQELATLMEYSIPVKIMLINNGCLGMVRQWQQFFYDKRYSQTVFGFNPDFTSIAKAYGLEAWRISESGEVAGGVKRLMAAKGPALLEVMIPLEENVLPMIPAGQGQTDFFEAAEEEGL